MSGSLLYPDNHFNISQLAPGLSTQDLQSLEIAWQMLTFLATLRS